MKDRQLHAIGKVILPIEIGVPATLLCGCMRYKTEPVTAIVKVSADAVIFHTRKSQYSVSPVDSFDYDQVKRGVYTPLGAKCA